MTSERVIALIGIGLFVGWLIGYWQFGGHAESKAAEVKPDGYKVGEAYTAQDHADAETNERRLRESQELCSYQAADLRKERARSDRLEAMLKLETNRRISIGDQLVKERREHDVYDRARNTDWDEFTADHPVSEP